MGFVSACPVTKCVVHVSGSCPPSIHCFSNLPLPHPLSNLHPTLCFSREQFLKSNAQLTFRCRQLLSELSYIYPITVVSQ